MPRRRSRRWSRAACGTRARCLKPIPRDSSMRWHIGTSGWGYARWMGEFYPEGTPDNQRLAYYAKHFDTVEINNTFYRLPSRSQMERWEDAVPERFIFCVKASG